MKFTYYEFPVNVSPSSQNKKLLYRPIVPIIFIGKKKIIGYEALIDSGSDFNVFDAGIADVLGVNLTSGHKRQILGIGAQKLKGYEHIIDIRVAGKKYETKIIFSRHIPPNSYGILGQQGFFDNFEVKFDYRKKYIEVI